MLWTGRQIKYMYFVTAQQRVASVKLIKPEAPQDQQSMRSGKQSRKYDIITALRSAERRRWPRWYYCSNRTLGDDKIANEQAQE